MNDIAFDFDDTICDFSSLIRDYFLKNYDIDVTKIWDTGEFHINSDKVTKKEITDIIYKKLMTTYMKDAKPLHNSIRWLNKFYIYTKKPIIIVTARPQFVCTNTIEWMKHYASFPFVVTCTGRSPKHNYIKKINIKYYVDDRIDVAEKIKNNSDVEKIWLMSRPWNKNINNNNPYIYKKVESLEEVYIDYIKIK